MSMDLRLVAYEPGGARLGVMPEPLSVNASLPFNDVGSLSVTYSALAAGGGLLERGLEQGLEVAVEVAHGTTSWTEPAGGRFLLIERRQDPLDQSGTVTLTMPSAGWLLRKAHNLETANLLPEDHGQAGKRPFYSASAGMMLATLLQENTARGGITLPRGFSATRDASNAVWSMVATLYFDLGLDLWTILRSLTDQGMCDWTTVQRELRVYNADTVLAQDRTVGDTPVRLHLGRDVIEAPEDESLVDVVGRVLIRGDEGLALTETNPSAPSPWGVWEGFIQQGGVSDEGTARALVQADLARGGRVRGQYTRTILPATANHLPLAHYGPGDYVLAPGGRGGTERLRVQQITLTRDSSGVAGNLVLNDRIVEAELRRTRRITGVVGGSSADGGSGVRPTPEGPDRRQPAAPTGLVVSSNAYIDETGEPRGQVTAVFGEVNTDTDGVALEVVDYQLWGRPNVAGAPWRHLTTTDTLRADYSPLPVGQEWLFRVRARGRYNAIWGAWSTPVGVLIARDTTPPPKPSPTVLASALGAITVEWDGRTHIDTAQPVDFDHAEIIMSSTTSSVQGETVGEFRRAGTWPITGQAVGEARHFWLRSVDTSGNASPLSDRRQVTVVSVRDVDLVDTTIGDQIEDVAHGPVDGDRVIPGTLRVDALTVGIGNRVVDPTFSVETIRDNRVTSGVGVTFSTVTDLPGSSYSARVTSALPLSATEDPWDGLAEVAPGSMIYMTVAAKAFSAPANLRFQYMARYADGSTNYVAVPGWSDIPLSSTLTWYNHVWEVPANVVAIQMHLYSAAGTAWFERPYWQVQTDGVLIEDGAVTADKIEANSIGTTHLKANAVEADKIDAGAVTAAKISSDAIETRHLAADAITAKHTITGATVQTRAQSSRGVKLLGSGLYAYDTNGNRTFYVSGTTGSTESTGEFRTGTTGHRVRIAPDANENNQPGIRLYSGGAGARDAALFIVGSTSQLGWDSYDTALTGSETVRNSSGRADLILKHGGDFALIQQAGSYSGYGVVKDGRDLGLRGRHPGTGSSIEYIRLGAGDLEYIAQDASYRWYVVYGSPVPVGFRDVQATAHASSSDFPSATATVFDMTGSGVGISVRAHKFGSYRYRYQAIWA